MKKDMKKDTEPGSRKDRILNRILNRIHNTDCIDGMKMLADSSVSLTVTSPPYDDIKEVLSVKDGRAVKSYRTVCALRTYKGYSWDIEKTAAELFRVTKPGGVVVWIMGDPVTEGTESLASSYTRIIFREAGFRIHDTMIYEKNNFSKPDSTRYHQVFDYMFIFSKGRPSVINFINDRKNIRAGALRKTRSFREKDGSISRKASAASVSDYGRRHNIWRYVTSYGAAGDTDAYRHPAVFPEKLAADHIISWSSEGDTVMDIFCGSGTTAKMAKLLRRNFIGFEISPEYCAIAEERIKKVCLTEVTS